MNLPRFEHDGFAVEPCLDRMDVEALAAELERLPRIAEATERGGLRNLLEASAAVRALASSRAVRALVAPVLGRGAGAVRGILFDKTADANWKVIWHQDLTNAVADKVDAPGFGPWSVKAGVQCVQPPVAILESMLAIRIHLDRCGRDNGPLRVLPGSHRLGRMSADAIARCRTQHAEVVLTAQMGEAILMRPLLLHASSAAADPARRRVVHLEFASGPLPEPLAWRTWVAVGG